MRQNSHFELWRSRLYNTSNHTRNATVAGSYAQVISDPYALRHRRRHLSYPGSFSTLQRFSIHRLPVWSDRHYLTLSTTTSDDRVNKSLRVGDSFQKVIMFRAEGAEISQISLCVSGRVQYVMSNRYAIIGTRHLHNSLHHLKKKYEWRWTRHWAEIMVVRYTLGTCYRAHRLIDDMTHLFKIHQEATIASIANHNWEREIRRYTPPMLCSF